MTRKRMARPRLFHYTVGIHVERIERSGYLNTSPKVPEPREKPVVWFSTNAFYEHTARKPVWDGTKTRILQLDELDALAGGIFRYVLPAELDLGIKALPWPQLRDVAHVPAKATQRMLAIAEQVGSRPSDWWGYFEPVPVADLQVERLDGGEWRPVTRPLQLALPQGVSTSTLSELPVGLKTRDFR